MGAFSVMIKVGNLKDAHLKMGREIEAIVDTGATLTTISTDILEAMGVPKLGEKTFRLADGRTVQRHIGGALIEVMDQIVPATVVFGERDDPCLLGAACLEQAGVTVDPIKKKLVLAEYIQQY